MFCGFLKILFIFMKYHIIFICLKINFHNKFKKQTFFISYFYLPLSLSLSLSLSPFFCIFSSVLPLPSFYSIKADDKWLMQNLTCSFLFFFYVCFIFLFFLSSQSEKNGPLFI